MVIEDYAAFCQAPLFKLKANPVRRRSYSLVLCSDKSGPTPTSQSRRSFLAALTAFAVSSTLAPPTANARSKKTFPNLVLPENIVKPDSSALSENETDLPPGASSALPDPKSGEVVGYQTDSGITFMEFEKGAGRKPNWGDLVNIHYTLYTLAPSKKDLIEHESTFKKEKDGYLIHHGNGEHILGLEEMIHSMSTGSKRRCILPRKLGYSQSGLAPVPYSARDRKKFLSALNEGDGTVVMDVELRWIASDANDRGYYTDLVPTDEEIIKLMEEMREENLEPGVPSIEI